TEDSGWECSGAICNLICGNGYTDEDNSEECDDGNDVAGDGCTACVVDEGWDCSGEACILMCGNGESDNGESCDDGSSLNGTYGYCKTDCSGMGESCGDGVIQSAHESCDYGSADVAGCIDCEFHIYDVRSSFGAADPDVAALSNGNFVICYETLNRKVGETVTDELGGIGCRLLDSNGTPIGTQDIPANTITAVGQDTPRVAALAYGQFVVTWRDKSLTEDVTRHRRFTSVGAGIESADVLTSGSSTNSSILADVAAYPDGRFIIAYGYGPAPYQIYVRDFKSDGSPNSPHWGVITGETEHQGAPALATLEGGPANIVWTQSIDPSGSDIWGWTDGGTSAILFDASSSSASAHEYPSIACTGSVADSCLVLWDAGATGKIYARRFNYAGSPVDTPAIELAASGGARDGEVVVLDQSTFLVFYRADAKTWMRKFAVDGTVGDAVEVVGAGASPTAAVGTDHLLVCWNGGFCRIYPLDSL
ncbi:DUF4215 domain-containing protein, partial [Myxococcota bacterium]|nr:DUF4215 domain-containing protein [Myxococcota bacterium]